MTVDPEDVEAALVPLLVQVAGDLVRSAPEVADRPERQPKLGQPIEDGAVEGLPASSPKIRATYSTATKSYVA